MDSFLQMFFPTAMMAECCSSPEFWHDSVHFVWTYLQYVVLFLTLLAITIYRKELSCNHCYSIPDEGTAAGADSTTVTSMTPLPDRRTFRRTLSRRCSSYLLLDDNHYNLDTHNVYNSSSTTHQDDTADSLLEEVSLYYSGAFQLLKTILSFLHCILPTKYWKSLKSWWYIAADGNCRLEELLEGAEHHWSGALLSSPPPLDILVPSDLNETSHNDDGCWARIFPKSCSCSSDGLSSASSSSSLLPTDVAVQIMEFLHPRDVLNLGCTCKQAQETILICPSDNSHSSSATMAIWKALWYRDYAWLVLHWKVGRQALQRSGMLSEEELPPATFNDAHVEYSKEFYFRFGLCYQNYILGGQCKTDCCLIGLGGGHVYDMTDFLDKHPGSSETVQVHAGRDASCHFESMRHTMSARKYAQQHLCIVVDLTRRQPQPPAAGGKVQEYHPGCGARPTKRLLPKLLRSVMRPEDRNHDDDEEDSVTATTAIEHHHHHQHHSLPAVPTPVEPELPNGCPQVAVVPSTLFHIRQAMVNEKRISQRYADRLKATSSRSRSRQQHDDILDEVHTYYDPFQGKWKAWYKNVDFDTVFVEDL